MITREEVMQNYRNAKKIRSFVCVDGFQDKTRCIHCFPDGQVFLIYNDGTRRQSRGISLENCLEFVEKGTWKEITNDRSVSKETLVPELDRDARLIEIAKAAIEAEPYVTSCGLICVRNGIAGERLIRLCDQEWRERVTAQSEARLEKIIKSRKRNVKARR